jgi:hypothetical protein
MNLKKKLKLINMEKKNFRLLNYLILKFLNLINYFFNYLRELIKMM